MAISFFGKYSIGSGPRKEEKLYIHSVQPQPPFCSRGGGGRSASNQIFKKGGEPDRGRDLKISTFRGGDVFQGVQFSPKNKVKSGIFNDKKSLQGKIFFSAITKNSNWEILP